MLTCFDSPFGDAGYDVSDYCKVAPRYGTNEDLIQVFEEAHKLDMHVLLDLVLGHTSWKHPWFLESMKAEKNEFTYKRESVFVKNFECCCVKRRKLVKNYDKEAL